MPKLPPSRILTTQEIFAACDDEPLAPRSFLALVHAVAALARSDMKLQLRVFLEHLAYDTQVKLLVLMYAGRGDGDFGRGSTAYFMGQFPQDKNEGSAAQQMMNKAYLSRFLLDGLARAEREGFDVEREVWP